MKKSCLFGSLLALFLVIQVSAVSAACWKCYFDNCTAWETGKDQCIDASSCTTSSCNNVCSASGDSCTGGCIKKISSGYCLVADYQAFNEVPNGDASIAFSPNPPERPFRRGGQCSVRVESREFSPSDESESRRASDEEPTKG